MGKRHPHKAPFLYRPDYRSAAEHGAYKKRADCLQKYGVYFISAGFGKLQNNRIVVSVSHCQGSKNGNQIADGKTDGRAQ